MIVADANLIVYRHLAGPFTPLADAARAKDGDWRTVPLWRFEFASALVTMIRAKVVQEATALAALAAAEVHMAPREVPVPQERAVQTAMKYGISAYDAQYVLLAEMLGTTCVTSDVPLVRKVPIVCTLLSDFAP